MNHPLPAAFSVETSSLFTPWCDPLSGVESFVLQRRVAPLQQSFYYTTPSFTDDGRYLWFYCGFPPAGNANYGRTLAVVDFERQEIRHYPETQFLDASPAVDLRTGEAYWCTGPEIWKRGPLVDASPELVNRLPAEIVRGRRPWRIATHLTFSADRKALAIDAEIGREWFVGCAPLDGTPVEIWARPTRAYNHAQFCPDPRNGDLILVNQDSSTDPVTGECPNYENRMWLLRRDHPLRPLYPDAQAAVAHMHGHEWWSADGRHVWYIHYGRGVMRVNPFIPNPESEPGTTSGPAGNPEPENIWPLDYVSHAHTSADETLVVADCFPGPRTGPAKVAFLNRATGRTADIVTHMPYPPEPLPRYHAHPHPQFCYGDRYICYTTFVHGRSDLALTPVSRLLEATA
ncbi:hypothetical protein OpiT1DRAFT_01539 [Opitutaceae bacterium TAV1]|nr:hypothetical protein OpiT1DRAFT_01539 [Opitutaceae bacterium TAV1]